MVKKKGKKVTLVVFVVQNEIGGENTENICVYNLQIIHNAEKKCTATNEWHSKTSRAQSRKKSQTDVIVTEQVFASEIKINNSATVQ